MDTTTTVATAAAIALVAAVALGAYIAALRARIGELVESVDQIVAAIETLDLRTAQGSRSILPMSRLPHHNQRNRSGIRRWLWRWLWWNIWLPARRWLR